MSRCCVPGCFNVDAPYKYPDEGPLHEQWTTQIKKCHQVCRDRNWKPYIRSVICPKHFTDDDFYTCKIGDTEVLTTALKPEAIPTINLSCKRHKTMPRDTVPNPNTNPLFDENVIILPPRSGDKFILESSENPVVINTQLKLEVNTLTQEYQTFKEEYSMAPVDKEDIENTHELTEKLTGIMTYQAFTYVITISEPYLKQNFHTMLRPITQLLLTLTKLKLNIPDRLLSIVYSIPVEEVCKIYLSWIKAMSLAMEKHNAQKLEVLKASVSDVVDQHQCYYVGYVAVSKVVAKSNDSSSWIYDPTSEYETITKHAVCVVSSCKQLVFVGSLVEEGAPIMPILQESRAFMDLLTDHDKVYLLPTKRVVLKRDIELGVVLEVDEEQQVPTKDLSYAVCKQMIKSAGDFQILSERRFECADELWDKIAKLCASLACLDTEN